MTEQTRIAFQPRLCSLCGAAGPFFSVTGATDRVACGHCHGHILLAGARQVERPTSLFAEVGRRLASYRWEVHVHRPFIVADHRQLGSTGQQAA